MTTTIPAYLEGYGPSATRVVQALLSVWPEHGRYLNNSLGVRDADLRRTTEIILDLLARVSEHDGRSLEDYARSYRYLCEEIVAPEELFFQRHGRYRLSTFAEAEAEVYANAAMMARYMDGLFASDGLWLNHANALHHYRTVFLPALPPGGTHLEIGPGHGLLLHLAIESGRFDALTAWDVSATSIRHAGEVLEMLGEGGRVDLQLRDLYATRPEDEGRFSAIVFSEVLEHLEQPREALGIVRRLLAPDGRVWINVPINGPAPDHLLLFRSPEEAMAMIVEAGFEVVDHGYYPVAGTTLERARKIDAPISCVFTARPTGLEVPR